MFDNITKDDLIIAFFPCIYFCCMSMMAFTLGYTNYKKMNDIEKIKKILERDDKRNSFYQMLLKFVSVCLEKNMSFETDLQKVRNEGRGLDWYGFLKLDADKAIKKFVRSNWEKFGWKWAARNCRDYRRLLDCLCGTINFPEPQELFYSVSQKGPEVRSKVYKRSLGFGHCRFCITLSWPFVVYYRSVADIVAEEATASTDVAKMVAQRQAKYTKEYAFEKEFSFEFSQCEKSAKWTMNSVFLPFLNARFYEIAQAMRNPPKELQEFRAQN